MAENQHQDVQCENCGWQGSQSKEMMGQPCPRCGHQTLRPKDGQHRATPAGVSAKLETDDKTKGKADKK